METDTDSKSCRFFLISLTVDFIIAYVFFKIQHTLLYVINKSNYVTRNCCTFIFTSLFLDHKLYKMHVQLLTYNVPYGKCSSVANQEMSFMES